MKLSKKLATLTVIAAAIMAQAAQAQETTFVNPDWANSAWYVGGAFGQSRHDINEQAALAGILRSGAATASVVSYERQKGYKLFMGKQLNKNFAVELGYFDLGTFHYDGFATPGAGRLNAEESIKGINLDLLAQLPLTQRLSVYGRLGMNYAMVDTTYNGNLVAASGFRNSDESKVKPKVGLGVEYKLSEPMALRFEAERNRVNSNIGSRNADLYSVALVYKLGRPAAAPVVYTPPPVVEAAPAPVVEAPAPAPAPAPMPVSEKVSFAAEALFDFDKSVVKPEGKAALDDLLVKLQGMNPEVMITVGHTDSVGSDAYNQKLSLRRSAAVKAYLISKGVEASRVYTEGKGEAQPIADNKTAAGRAQNRRVTIEVVGTRTVTK